MQPPVGAVRAPVSGSVAAAAAPPKVGSAVGGAWRRVMDGTCPLLHRFLLRYSVSPEAWLARRVVLARSLATSSIAGWLIGLGDRAPHRLLLDKTTAEVMHVGTQAILQQRPYTETGEGGEDGTRAAGAAHGEPTAQPPFRLTRELVDAIGGAVGIEGVFRCAAEATLRVSHAEGASAALMTIIEAFVDEPMTGWRAASESAAVPWAVDGVDGATLAARLDAEVAVLHAQERLSHGESLAARAARPPMNVESRVRQLIAHARSEEVLASQSPSWRAWL
jgi:ataxia telangiectasia mutated family protein